MTALETERQDLEARLESLRAGKVKKVTKEEREKVEKEWRVMRGVAVRREKISKEMWKTIEGFVGEKEERAELRERLGLDE